MLHRRAVNIYVDGDEHEIGQVIKQLRNESKFNVDILQLNEQDVCNKDGDENIKNVFIANTKGTPC
jgi:hypothetical protein